MKSIFLYVFIFALVTGALCERLRRQAPPDAADGADVDGATPPPKPTTSDKLNDVVAGLILDQKNKTALGEPVDPKTLDKILKLTMVINIVGGEVSESNKEGIDQLLSAPAEPAPSDE